ncbi:hypothetical protein Tco_0121696 [Tanacetum coccineum]
MIFLYKSLCNYEPLRPITSQRARPDDDYVAPATNPILNKHLNEFGEEFDDNTRVSKKIDSNLVNDLKELLKTYDFETFIQKLLQQLSQSSNKTGETRLFYRYFARSHLLQSSFEEESATLMGSLLF